MIASIQIAIIGRRPLFCCLFSQKLKNIIGIGIWFCFLKYFDYHALFVNDVGGAHDSHCCFSVGGLFLPHIICVNRLKLRVRQKDKRQFILCCKILMGFAAVLADSDHDDVIITKTVVSFFECARLLCTARRIILGIKINYNFSASEI